MGAERLVGNQFDPWSQKKKSMDRFLSAFGTLTLTYLVVCDFKIIRWLKKSNTRELRVSDQIENHGKTRKPSC